MTFVRAAAIVVALAAFAFGVWRGTWAVGGSDSSCYALMAQAFAGGELQPTAMLAARAPWPDASLTFAPGGFIPSPSRSGAASPICAPGFALLLAPLYALAGRDAIFLLTPVAGAVLVYLTYVLGRRFAGEVAGLAAAVIVATAPVFAFQLVQPMNDVAVAALWTAVIALALSPSDRNVALGLVTGLAILVRPNLAPAALPIAVWCAAAGWRRLVVFAASIAPFVIAVIVLNYLLYGHPLRTGYGSAEDLFAASYVATNLKNYGSSIIGTQLALPLLGFAALFWAPRQQLWNVAVTLSVAALVILIYLFYRPLPEWWYLRFLLPSLALLTSLATAMVVWSTRRHALLIPIVLAVIGYSLSSSAMRDALDLTSLERRFRIAASVARERLPENAVFITVWESGSVRYHAGREALLWDSLPPTALDDACAWLESEGREPYIMIEDWEEPLFRQRFAEHSALGGLDWPPRFEVERRVKIYRPADRASYWEGASIPTEFVWTNRR